MPESPCLSPIPWETRNLGVPSFELPEGVLGSSGLKALREEIQRMAGRHGRFFIQTRLGREASKFTGELEREGFRYIEGTLVPFTVFRQNPTYLRFQENPASFVPKLYDPGSVRFKRVGRDDRKAMEWIRNAAREAFSDDRFHRDPSCPPRLADERFVHWIGDMEKEEEVGFYVLCHQDEPVAFTTREGEHLILTGFDKSHVLSGLGDFLWLSTLADMSREGLQMAHTLISTNNTAILNLYARIGFKFKDPRVTLHFWGGGAAG